MRKALLAVKIIFTLYVLLLLVVYLGQRFIIFQPKDLPKSTTFAFETPFEEHFLETAPGVEINYLHFKGTKPIKGIVLYFHGNAGNLARWGKVHKDFTERGFDIIIPDYRGYGKSTGTVSEEDTYKDMRRLHDHILRTQKPTELIIYGRSLGSGVATHLAKAVPAKLLILETPFYNMQSLFSDQLQIVWLPFSLRYQFPNYKNIPAVDYPICVFHGTNDMVVPYRNAIKLKSILKKEDTFVTIKNGTHHNLSSFEEYQRKLDGLLETQN
ncbi:MAG: alpha/beta hydrolase [Saprospiraceae bacterium]